MDNAPATTGGTLGTQFGMASGFNRLGIFRQIGLMIGLAASVAIGFAVVLWSQEPEYRPLMGDLSNLDASQVVETLQQSQIPYRIDAASGALLVPAEHLYQARLKLAADGLTGDKNIGFELMDQEQALGTSQFMETTRFRRGLEGELARTISSFLAVKSARVHLAVPKRSVFVRDSRKPTASVFVELYAGRDLDKTQVASIANLVASSISELKVSDVTVVDQKGRLLNSQDVDEEVTMAARQLDYTRKVEERLAAAVRGILQPVVGAERFKAEVSADVDFTAVEQTDELFHPDLPSLRSEKVLEESRLSGAAAGGIPGALTNQPPGAAAVPEQGGADFGAAAGTPAGGSRSQATRNFELDRTISYTKHQQGRIRRLTVAVAVDDVGSRNSDTGAVERRPWSEADIQRLNLLVRDAVGYSAARGDSVNVINTAFAEPDTIEPLPELDFWSEPWFWDLMKQVGAGAFVLLLVFGVLRPIMKNLSASASGESHGGSGGELEGIADASLETTGMGMDEGPMLPGPNESYERQLDAVRSLVAEDPGRVAQVVKQWIAADE